MNPAIHVLGIAGSLRRASYNRALLGAAEGMLPAGMSLERGEIGELPLYDADLEARGVPAPVRALAERVSAADALLIATPEYNYSVPGVLKNALDWLSRPPAASPLKGKPAAILGASRGRGATMRAQLHLRDVALGTGLILLPRPELHVALAQEKFDPEGTLTDERTREQLAGLLAALRDWTLRLASAPAGPAPQA